MPVLGADVKILLMAGGRCELGELPDLFARVDSGHSLLRCAFERAVDLVDPRAVFVVTGTAYEPLIRQELPELHEVNLIIEPTGRHTLPALGLAALWIERIVGPATLIAMPSDHQIGDERKFQAALLSAVAVAKEGYLVSLGIKPARADSCHSYMRAGSLVGDCGGLAATYVSDYIEKPEEESAAVLMDSPAHFWDSGILICQIGLLQSEISRFLPKVHELFRVMSANAQTLGELQTQVTARFRDLPNISIGSGILERSDRLVMIPASFGWNDVSDLLVDAGRDRVVEAFERAPGLEVQVITKPWGREVWWAPTERYEAKVIEVKAGQSLSLKSHKRKHEMLYIESGTGRMRVGNHLRDLRPGQVFTLPPGTVHRLEAASPVRIFVKADSAR